jgi:sugar phosphate isomerase/epimerase
MKLACGTVLFRQHPIEKALEAIREAGYEYVETQAVGPWCPHVEIGKTDPIKFADLVRSYGFKGITAIWMPCGTIISNEKSVEMGIRTLEWAHAADIGVVNTGDGFKPEGIDTEEAYKIYEDRMTKIVNAAEKNKTIIAIEPHGTFSLTGDGLVRLMSLTDSKWLGINYDACNIHRAGYIESKGDTFSKVTLENKENETEVLKRIVSRVVHVHAKDIRDGKCVPLGEGTVNVSGCIEILKKSGYDGAISLETEGDEDFETSFNLAKKGLSYLRKNKIGGMYE